MTDLEELKAIIKESGMTMVAVAEKAGMVRETLYNRLAGKGEFTASEIVGLTAALRLTVKQRDSIFFVRKVENNATDSI